MNYAISPLDGRYSVLLNPLRKYFSEEALFEYRVKVEILYFQELCEKHVGGLSLTRKTNSLVSSIIQNFSAEDYARIKAIEKITNHDVKAVEYFIREKLESLGLRKFTEYVHFGLTSQDINNTAIPMLIRDATKEELIPLLTRLVRHIRNLAAANRNVTMLARTHGQPASPTTLGKEFAVFAERLELQLKQLKTVEYSGKFGGATGNFNAHCVAFPKVKWNRWADLFLKRRLGLKRQQTTTQIAHYDELANWCHNMIRINTILIDLSRDIWSYISMEYLTQAVKPGEVGSSAMPHKVNPIDFENAEGNLGISSALAQFFAEKLPVSRLQRDLTDSTVLRNIGVPFSHTFLAGLSILKGLSKISVNKTKIRSDLNDHWIILAEGIQTILRREGVEGSYEILKALTRGKATVSRGELQEFIHSLKVNERVKKELLHLTPFNYIGLARQR
ncbi:MAG: adenylosuccinate lyase [Saprospiraceae bacterium]|nr:adenylosuccinate lyase [Saprospiraceae bacterium]HMX89105.1 adenylosuccinate lyase [Saprospiraceae bacterium]HMZ40976.1 adenylosuccinate lyase [Saprospiraceae bacterium]HNB30413.1 adenylosuccinate lyase [Saprospiraceae bacterium]HNC37674.1 adenylosuccinate lyase [Saprospiraceae bacterium]